MKTKKKVITLKLSLITKFLSEKSSEEKKEKNVITSKLFLISLFLFQKTITKTKKWFLLVALLRTPAQRPSLVVQIKSVQNIFVKSISVSRSISKKYATIISKST